MHSYGASSISSVRSIEHRELLSGAKLPASLFSAHPHSGVTAYTDGHRIFLTASGPAGQTCRFAPSVPRDTAPAQEPAILQLNFSSWVGHPLLLAANTSHGAAVFDCSGAQEAPGAIPQVASEAKGSECCWRATCWHPSRPVLAVMSKVRLT